MFVLFLFAPAALLNGEQLAFCVPVGLFKFIYFLSKLKCVILYIWGVFVWRQ